jgi:hypothetical protein
VLSDTLIEAQSLANLEMNCSRLHGMLGAGLRIMPDVRSRRRSSQPGGGFLLASGIP